MTTNEFKHRSVYYRLLDIACSILYFPEYNVQLPCWHVQVIDVKGLKYETYSSTLNNMKFGFNFLNPAKSIFLDYFSKDDFLAQFKYFVGFYKRLSEAQKSALKSSGFCNNLLRLYEGSE